MLLAFFVSSNLILGLGCCNPVIRCKDCCDWPIGGAPAWDIDCNCPTGCNCCCSATLFLQLMHTLQQIMYVNSYYWRWQPVMVHAITWFFPELLLLPSRAVFHSRFSVVPSRQVLFDVFAFLAAPLMLFPGEEKKVWIKNLWRRKCVRWDIYFET